MKGIEVKVAGYPDDKTLKASSEPWYELWGMSATIKKIDKQHSIIYNSINSAIGQSDSGVFYKIEDEEYYVVRIHLSARESTAYPNTCATWISKCRYVWISTGYKMQTQN